MATDNQFRPVGFGWGDLYEVNAQGVIRRIGTDRPIGTRSPHGYMRVQFSRGRFIAAFLAHKVVADAFLGPRPLGLHIDHKNGVRDDNRVENLRYCTPKENVGFTIERDTFPRGERNGFSVLTEDQVAMIRERKAKGGRYWGAAAIAEQLGVGESTVRQAARGFRYAAIRKLPVTP